MDWYHITHGIPMWLLPIWKKLFCHRGWHLFDEVASLGRHELYCDACGKTIGITYMEEEKDLTSEKE